MTAAAELADLRQRLAAKAAEWRERALDKSLNGAYRGACRCAAGEVEAILNLNATEEARLVAAVASAGDRRDWDGADDAEERLEAFKRKRRDVAEPVFAYGEREQ